MVLENAGWSVRILECGSSSYRLLPAPNMGKMQESERQPVPPSHEHDARERLLRSERMALAELRHFAERNAFFIWGFDFIPSL